MKQYQCFTDHFESDSCVPLVDSDQLRSLKKHGFSQNPHKAQLSMAECADNTLEFQLLLIFSLWNGYLSILFWHALSNHSWSSTSDNDINKTIFNTACKCLHICPTTVGTWRLLAASTMSFTSALTNRHVKCSPDGILFRVMLTFHACGDVAGSRHALCACFLSSTALWFWPHPGQAQVGFL